MSSSMTNDNIESDAMFIFSITFQAIAGSPSQLHSDILGGAATDHRHLCAPADDLNRGEDVQ